MSYYEIIGAVIGLISVWLTVRQNIWCWPTGLIMVCLYLIVFYQAKLYADMGLQVVYIILQIYGWYEWLHGGKDQGKLDVSQVSIKMSLVLTVIGIVGTVALGYMLKSRTDASLPYWDSTATILSLIAQWMMAKKILENWFVWVTVDILSIGIYLYKELYFTTVLYAAFLVLAI